MSTYKTNNKTRVARAKVDINKEQCKGCLLCIEVCPLHCLTVSEQMNTLGCYPIEYTVDTCTGCGMCYQICPDVCITITSNDSKSKDSKTS